jgi:putative heme-binding domain-containing protein
VDALRNDNMFWRLYAQRLLVERGQLDVVPELIKLAADHSVDTIGLNPAAIHALWTLHGLGVLGETDSQALKVADSALHHPSAGVRRNATEVLPRTARSVEKLIAANTLHDTDAQVRLAAFLALADMPSSSMAGSAVVAALRDERNSHDHWLNDAATCAAAAHAEFFLTAALTQPWQTQVPPGLTTLLERVAEHHARGGPRASVPPLVAKLALTATPIAGAIVKGWSRGWPQETRPVLDKTSEKHLVELFGRLDSAEQGQLVELAVKWHSNTLENQARELVNGFLGRIRNDRLNDLERGAAAGQLVDLRRCDSAVVSEILDCLTPRSSPELAVKLLDSITRSEASTSGAALIGRVPGLTPTARQAALRVLLSRSDWTTALLDAAEAGKVSMLDLTIDQRQGLLVHPRRDVAGRAKKLLARDAGIPNPDRQKVVAERLHLAQRRGDANAGKAIFKKNCAVCHVYAGEGGKVGPDLTGMAVHPKSELLVDIFDPSRNVEGNYRQYLLTTRSGRFLAGILSSETKTTVELIDAQAQRHVIQREDIEDLQATPKSLMPEGLEKQLSNEDLANLLEFLTQKSK